ncbi:MAG: hypothetical protein JHD02_11105 [Thermoleophilaceae bacterium]|nr:hypothetical protein [Thermoleophilaceae bacterium]
MKTVHSTAALDRATPARLWIYAALIALIGVAVRVIWFVEFEYDLPFAFGETLSGHAWALEPNFRVPVAANVAVNPYDVTRAFAPGYGAMLYGLVELAGGAAASNHTISIDLLAVQSVLVAIATLITFALARRVLFGYAALIPPLLLTASIALIELPGGLAPSIPLMLLVILAVWQLTILQERLPEGRGPGAMLLTIGAGFAIGAAILFNPAALLLAPLILWWAFRGLGAEHATLLLVAAILLPASWLAVAQSQLPEGIPTAQAKAWIQQDSGNFPTTLTQVGDRAYAIATPWNARFARGDYASSNWNYEWILPLSLRSDTSYQAATKGLVAFLILLSVLLVLLGLTELFAEGPGSGARLLALPVIALPFVTFLSDGGNILRIPMLPFLMIALTLGCIWLGENLKPYTRERRSDRRAEWT